MQATSGVTARCKLITIILFVKMWWYMQYNMTNSKYSEYYPIHYPLLWKTIITTACYSTLSSANPISNCPNLLPFRSVYTVSFPILPSLPSGDCFSTKILNIFLFYPPGYTTIPSQPPELCPVTILTLCRSNLNPHCLGRKAAFFSVGI